MKLKGFRPSAKALMTTAALALLCLVHDTLLVEASGIFASSQLFYGLAGLWLVILFIDVLVSKKPPEIEVLRRLPSNISVNATVKVELDIINHNKQPCQVAIADLQPETWEHSLENPIMIALEPESSRTFTYQTTPRKRGLFTLYGTQCRVTSEFGFWQMDWVYSLETETKVYPDFRMLHDLSGLQGSATLRQEGIRKYQKRGAGMDFKQLRDYREGESLRQVDWRATSRFNKLISREFQDEKNQSVVIMLDAGQRMMVQDAKLNYFDYALNTLIALSHTILKNGDELSLLSFGQSNRWLGKVKGVANISQVLNHFFDLHPRSIASDYLRAASELMEKCPKRSLVILVSSLRDEDFDDLLLAVQLLQKKHLVAVASIEDELIQQINQTEIETKDDAGTWLATQDLQGRIAKNRKALESRGVICISAPAANITPSTINTYLKVKKAGAL